MKQIYRDDNERMKRIYRICEIIAHEPLGTKEIASRLGVCTKTIQRDLNEILVKNGAIKKGRLWSIDKREFDPDDEKQIVLAVLDKVAKNIGAEFYSKAHGLLKNISEGLNHPIFININAEELDNDDMKTLESIENAISTKQNIAISYFKKDFTLSPIKIALFEGFWYLLAMDGEHFKKFHFKSVKNVRILADNYKIDEKLSDKIKRASSAWFNPNNEIIVRILVDKTTKKYFERKPLPNQQIMRENADGSIEIELNITHIMEIKPLVLYYLPHIKVIEPQNIADEIKADVKAYLSEIS